MTDEEISSGTESGAVVADEPRSARHVGLVEDRAQLVRVAQTL